MHPAFSRLDHRPWQIPQQRWSWRQTWCDLLFAHWPISAAQLQPLVPAPLRVQEFEGTSWIGLVPFRMQGVSLRPLPDLPGISAFPECNLRLYVEHDGKPGVWFLSLDATNPLAVWAARQLFHLPYFRAQISLHWQERELLYEVCRRGSARELELQLRYAASSEVYEAPAGTLEHWLTERYCLYAQAPDGRLFRTEVHHRPWQLQRADAEIKKNDLLIPHGLEVEGPPALLHFSKRLDVVIWSPEIL